jgi:hypothetical protein
MAGNLSEEKLYYQDYNNVILLDPNKVFNADGKPVDRLVQHENLISYANLTCNVIPRTKLAVGEDFNTEIRQVQLAKINFLRPSDKQFLDTTWTDELLGDYGNIGNTNKLNQSSEEQRKNLTNTNYDTQLLGITSISIRNNKIFIPEVTIELEDIQGRALFEKGEKSPYAAFFQLPYPLFELTVKGFYGKAVKYELNLVSFNARFNPGNGNYQISIKLVGRTPALFSDIDLTYMYALPYMYPATFYTDTTTNNQTTGDVAQDLQTQTTQGTTRGYQKLKEVYSVYKSKGLIPQDFPVMNLDQLRIKLDLLINQQLSSFGEENFSVLSDIARYEDDLQSFYNNIFGSSSGAWFNKWTTPTNYFISKTDATTRYYPIDSSGTTLTSIKDELQKIIVDKTKILLDNPTLGKDGKYSAGKVKGKSSSIDVNISVDDIILKDDVNIDFDARFKSENNNRTPTTAELQKFIQTFISSKLDATYIDPTKAQVVNNYGLVLKGPNTGFEQKIAQIRKQLKEKTEEIEKALTESLLEKIVDPNYGLGFNPTIRNVMAVIIAQVDAFLRLMDEVHSKAWDKRQDPLRLTSILGGINTDSTIPIPSEDQIVYPWPSYTEVKDAENKIVVKYPGDSTAFQKTGAYNFEVWPEVEFVEQFISGLIPYNEQVLKNPVQNVEQTPPYLSSNALEFPFTNIPYLNLTDVSVIYELFERTLVSSYYIGLMKGGKDPKQLYKVLGDFEKYNLLEQISESISLLELFKKTPLTAQNYEEVLRSSSNDATGLYWNQFIRDIYTTPYIREQLKTSSEILSIKSLENNSSTINNEQETTKTLQEYIVSNDSTIKDLLNTYPFDNTEWRKNNLAGFQGDSESGFYDTTKVLNFFSDKKVITNFTDVKSTTDRKPFNYFNWQENSILQNTANGDDLSNITTGTNLKQFFDERVDNTKKVVLEGSVYYSNYTNNVTATQTTSILNTPYFVNSFTQGVQNFKQNESHPFKAAAYLFLNSLPLATTLERYITKKENSNEFLNYIASTMTKFSGIHKLPFAWVLKYGSIWNRYKTYIETGVDFLDECWKDIDYTGLYDPIGSATTKTYSSSTVTYTMVTQQPTINNFQVGFYPKLVNDLTYLYVGKNVFSGYTDSEFQNALNQGLNIKENTTSRFFQVGEGVQNQFISSGYYSYFDLGSLVDLSGTGVNDWILFPSIGGLRFNQTSLEYFKDGVFNTNLINNKSYYNGTARMSWNSPNFGYFNTSTIRKPTPSEYMKVIFSGENKVQESFTLAARYSSIEEIFGVFDKATLDLFEQMFLKFCEHPKDYDNAQLGSGNFKNILTDNLLLETENFKFKNFVGVLKEFFRVNPSDVSSDSTKLSYELSSFQEKRILSHITAFMNLDVVLKIGNCGNYDRKLFDSLSGNQTLIPTDPDTFEKYELNTLPTGGGTITLLQSKALNPDAWITLEEYVGFSTISGLTYTDSGSYITDFFPTMDIAFTSGNIQLLSKVIKIFANEKLKNPSLTKTQFQTTLTDYINSLNENHTNVLNYTLQQVKNQIPTVIQKPVDFTSRIDGDVVKNDLWRLFKTLDEKWIAGGNFKEKTIFEEFLFFDRRNRDIGQKFIVDVYSIRKYLSDKREKTSLINFISGIFQDNRFNFFALPSYVNFYGIQEPGLNTGPTIGSDDIGSLAFGTFLEVDYQDSKPKYLCQFVGKLSEHLQVGENYYFGSDGLNLENPTENTLIDTNQDQNADLGLSNKVVAFAVDFGIQNQNIFTSMALDQAQHKVTAESLDIMMALANQYNSNSAMPQPQGLYDLYKSRSYSCEVGCMGSMLIQPTMYFQLRNVPMFSGAYLILGVEHDIRTGGEFTTKFKGTKVSKYEDETPEQLVTAVNRNYLNKIKDRIKKYKTEENFILATQVDDQAATSSPTGPASDSQTCERKIDAIFNQVPRKDGSVTSVTNNIDDQTLFDIISQVTTNKKIGINAFVFPHLLYNYGNSPVYVQNNLYNFILESANNRKLLGTDGVYSETNSYIDGCLCYQLADKNVVPLATFASPQKCVQAFVSINEKWIDALMKNPTISGTTYNIEPISNMTDTDKEQLFNTIKNCWTKYKQTIGGSVLAADDAKIRSNMNLYLSLL